MESYFKSITAEVFCPTENDEEVCVGVILKDSPVYDCLEITVDGGDSDKVKLTPEAAYAIGHTLGSIFLDAERLLDFVRCLYPSTAKNLEQLLKWKKNVTDLILPFEPTLTG